MALATRWECHCRHPHGEPGSKCWKCEGRVGRSSGSDHRSSQVRRTYIEELEPCLGGTFEGSDSSALAGPGGYYKRISSQGREWSGTMAFGGSSKPSYAHAGPDGIRGYAGDDGHAVAMYGRDGGFAAAIYGPGGQVLSKNWDGSTSRRKVDYEKQGRTRYIDEDDGDVSYSVEKQGRIPYDDEKQRRITYSDEDEGAVRYSEKKKKEKAIRHGQKNRRANTYGD